MFADEVTAIDPLTKWVAMLTVGFLAVTQVCTLIMNLLARWDAAKKDRDDKARHEEEQRLTAARDAQAKQAADDALKAAQNAAKAADRAAAEARVVKDTLLMSNDSTSKRLDKVAAKVDAVHDATAETLASVAVKVEEIRHATNSLTDRLVASTEKEALQRGAVDERARADAAVKVPPPEPMH